MTSEAEAAPPAGPGTRTPVARSLRRDYLDGGGWHKVDGWLYLKALRLTDFIDQCQDSLNIKGNIGEIGLYFGKYFIFLYLVARENEKVVGVDLFEDVAWEEKFHANLADWRHAGNTPVIVKRNSLEVTADDLLAWAGGPYRLFSVDGGHAMDVALHDLRQANAVLAEGGVIMVDDYFDPKFPGVSEAVSRFFLLSGEARVVPFLITGNKLFLATTAHGALYREAIRIAIDSEHEDIWEARMFDHPVTIIL